LEFKGKIKNKKKRPKTAKHDREVNDSGGGQHRRTKQRWLSLGKMRQKPAKKRKNAETNGWNMVRMGRPKNPSNKKGKRGGGIKK